jgi:hypothetical protein
VSSTRRFRILVGLVVAAAAGLVVLAAPAPAQTCGPSDPYSGGNPNCEQQAQLTIELSAQSGPPGASFNVHASGFRSGDHASISFGGTEVAAATASRGDTGRPATVDQTVQVPDVAAATYDVCVSAPNAQSACAPFHVTAGTVVAGVSFTRGGGGSLAKTGLMLLPFLILAVILILGGRYLVAKSRGRRA